MTSAIMDPTGGRRTAASAGLTLAPRPGTLERARIGLLENGKQNAGAMLEAVAAVLKERHGVGEVVMRRKEVFSAPAPPELVQELSAEADLVVIGVGDWGSCSASAVVDGILFERNGRPAAVICTEAFRATADAMASVHQAPGYHYVTTAHPVAGLSAEQVHERAEQVAIDVARLLGAEGG